MSARFASLRLRWFVAPLLCVAVAALIALPSRANEVGDASIDTSFSEPSDVSVAAGLVVDLSVTSTSTSGTAVVTIVSAAGTENVGVVINDGTGTVQVGPPHTMRSGVISVINEAGDMRSVLVSPAAGQRRMDINVGPTTIQPNNTTMAVGLLTDRWGNPVVDGSAVQLTVSSDNEENQRTELRTRNGLAVVALSDASLASDRFQLAMDGEGAFSSVVTVRVQPGTPSAFELLLENRSSLRADGRTRVNLSSTTLVDDAGQPLADGTHVAVELSGLDGRSRVSGEVVDGSVNASFIAPDLPGEVTITATVAGRTSAPLTLTFAPAVSSVPVQLDVVDGVRELNVGPVIGPDGGVLPEGTPVMIGDQIVGLVEGHASVAIATGAPIPVVRVLGVTGIIS